MRFICIDGTKQRVGERAGFFWWARRIDGRLQPAIKLFPDSGSQETNEKCFQRMLEILNEKEKKNV